MTPERLEQLQELLDRKRTMFRNIQERYVDVRPWCWQDGVLKEQETMEPVSIDGGDPPWDFVVFLPGDVKWMIDDLQEIKAALEGLLADEAKA